MWTLGEQELGLGLGDTEEGLANDRLCDDGMTYKSIVTRLHQIYHDRISLDQFDKVVDLVGIWLGHMLWDEQPNAQTHLVLH